MKQSERPVASTGVLDRIAGDARIAPGGPVVRPPEGGESFDFGGLGVAWKIDAVETGANDKPVDPVTIVSIRRYEAKDG